MYAPASQDIKRYAAAPVRWLSKAPLACRLPQLIRLRVQMFSACVNGMHSAPWGSQNLTACTAAGEAAQWRSHICAQAAALLATVHLLCSESIVSWQATQQPPLSAQRAAHTNCCRQTRGRACRVCPICPRRAAQHWASPSASALLSHSWVAAMPATTEDEVGISCYVSSKTVPFTAILKHRYPWCGLGLLFCCNQRKPLTS